MIVSPSTSLGPKVSLSQNQPVQPDDDINQFDSTIFEEQKIDEIKHSQQVDSASVKPIVQLPYQKEIDQVMIDFNQYINIDENWSIVIDEKNCKTHTRRLENSNLLMSRAEIEIECSAETVLSFISNIDNRKNYQEKIKSLEILENYSETRFQNRDIVAVQDVIRKDHIIYFVQKSVQYQKKPEQKDLVRASLYFSVMRLEQINAMSSAKQSCKLTFVDCRDLGGEIPDFVKELVAKSISLSVKTIKKLLENKK